VGELVGVWRGKREEREWFTFLPITPRQAIDGIAILIYGFRNGAVASLYCLNCCGTEGGGVWQSER
jgi:hypothetical protein